MESVQVEGWDSNEIRTRRDLGGRAERPAADVGDGAGCGSYLRFPCGGIAALLRQQGETQLLQGFEALSEALFWLNDALEQSICTLLGDAASPRA